MKTSLLLLAFFIQLAVVKAQDSSLAFPIYKGEVVEMLIEDEHFRCDSTDTVQNTVYCWEYLNNRWFARVFKYYDATLTQLEAKYVAHMAISLEKDWYAIYMGNFYEYRKNGTYRSIIRFEDGMRKGPAKYFNKHGILRQAGEYYKEMRVGTWRYYNRKGALLNEVEYKHPPIKEDEPEPTPFEPRIR